MHELFGWNHWIFSQRVHPAIATATLCFSVYHACCMFMRDILLAQNNMRVYILYIGIAFHIIGGLWRNVAFFLSACNMFSLSLSIFSSCYCCWCGFIRSMLMWSLFKDTSLSCLASHFKKFVFQLFFSCMM